MNEFEFFTYEIYYEVVAKQTTVVSYSLKLVLCIYKIKLR